MTDLVSYWLEDIELADRLSKTTRNLYERKMRTLVLPVLGKLTLRELGVARCDHFLKQLAKQSDNRAKQAKVVLRLALAVRHEVLAIRRCDIDTTSKTPSIRLAGTIISRKGEPTFRQDHLKTARSKRTVALPSFTAEAARCRLADRGSSDPDDLLFH